MSLEGFYFNNADEAMEYYKRCEREGATTYEAKMAILRALVKEKKAGYVPNPEKFIEGKNVLKITKKDGGAYEKSSN